MGRWDVEVVKCLQKLPGNLTQIRLPNFEEAGIVLWLVPKLCVGSIERVRMAMLVA